MKHPSELAIHQYPVERVIPISRVRVTNSTDTFGGWNVEYLPAGKSKWFWNWRVYRTERNEESARRLADILATEKTVTLSGYAKTEVVL